MSTRTEKTVQNWFSQLDRRIYAILIGLLIGGIGATIGLMIALIGPLLTTAAVVSLIIGLFILTNMQVALYMIIVIMTLLPFGTLPFSIGFTPTLLDVVIGVFVLIYILQWMTGKRNNIQITPVHGFIAIYILWIFLAFVLGLRYASPTPLIMRQFAETVIAFGLVFVLVDIIRDEQTLRRIVLVVIISIGVQALLAIGLYILPDNLAESSLRLLSRIGYPSGNIIRYIESNPALSERAIGTWVDPNTLGGALAIAATMISPQVFAKKPVLKYRWLTVLVILAVLGALFLTYSRTAMLAFGIGIVVIAAVRYRRFIPVMILFGLMALLLPQTQGYIERFFDAFRGGDLATQMRIGEITDSLRLIQRYPIFGVGFTGTPEIDIYTDVANMYLIMANQIGLVGVMLFSIAMMSVFVYGIYSWKYARNNMQLDSIHLGYHAALVTVLVSGIGDLYYFRIDFQASITLFWIVVALALSTSKVALQARTTVIESKVDKTPTIT